jgi:hypothetical protein
MILIVKPHLGLSVFGAMVLVIALGQIGVQLPNIAGCVGRTAQYNQQYQLQNYVAH